MQSNTITRKDSSAYVSLLPLLQRGYLTACVPQSNVLWQILVQGEKLALEVGDLPVVGESLPSLTFLVLFIKQ